MRHPLVERTPARHGIGNAHFSPDALVRIAIVVFCIASLSSAALADGSHSGKQSQSANSRRTTSEIYGSVPTQDGSQLHIVTDLGNVIIRTQDSGKVDYHVHLEADASQKGARELLRSFHVEASQVPDGVSWKGRAFGRHLDGRLWVTLYVNIPKSFNVDVSTAGGNIEMDDLNGRATLATAGGDITAGNIGGQARLETGGGHISVKNVAGGLIATTGGGHITAGAIGGNAVLHTSGGHIRVASVEGVAHLETGGGNVTLAHSGAELVAQTGGGQIEVGEAGGLVRARTGGGGIRVVRLSGPTNLQSTDGSIYLTQVDSAVRASTSAGGITAWFVAPVKSPSTCELQSDDGDIVVYIPRQLPITIDAQIQRGDDHRVIFDPSFPLKVSYDDSASGPRSVRAEGELNGGGEVLRLRTVAGNIHVALSDSSKQMLLYKQQMEQLQQQMTQILQLQLRALEQSQDSSDAPPQP